MGATGDDFLFQQWERMWARHHRYVEKLILRFSMPIGSIEGDHVMFNGQVGNPAVPCSVHGVDALGNPAQGTLTNVQYTSSDSAIVAFTADPNNPLGALMNQVGPGAATISVTADATEPDGHVHQVSGSDSVMIAAAAVPPVDHLVIDFQSAQAATGPSLQFAAARRSQTLRR